MKCSVDKKINHAAPKKYPAASDPNPLSGNCSCNSSQCGESEGKEEKSEKIFGGTAAKTILYLIGTVIFIAGILAPSGSFYELPLFLAAYLIWGGGVLLRAFRNILKGKVFDENFLMCIATLGAFAIREYPEAVAVMIFYRVGEMLEDRAVNRSRRSIRELMNIRPDFARLKTGESYSETNPENVRPGDIITVRPGEKIPLDGRILRGNSTLDLAALTGETFPGDVAAGDEVLSGSVNKTGLLDIEVTKEYRDSTVNRILQLVENASERKAKTEQFITRFARYYTPAVVAVAAALAVLPPLLFAGQDFSTWIYRALIFLVISCPCALVISIPLGFMGGIGGASRRGILVKGGNFLEALGNIHTVVFDKTGTLTKGTFAVEELLPAPGFGKEELLSYAAVAARHTTHPVAASILKAEALPRVELPVESFREFPGKGVAVETSQGEILMGNFLFIKENDVTVGDENVSDSGKTELHLSINSRYAGKIVIADEIRDDAAAAVQRLRDAGVKKIAMLSGDRRSVAEAVGKKTGIDTVYAELLPHQKVEILEELKTKTGDKKLVFVGDGINDAPALARADVGVAIGGIGSDAALEAADVVLMTGEPSKLAEALKIARKTKTIVIQNIVLALGIKGVIMVLGAAGMASMWEAVFADVGVAFLAIMNSLRTLKA